MALLPFSLPTTDNFNYVLDVFEKKKMNRSQSNAHPPPPKQCWKTRSDVIKEEKGDKRKFLESCVGTERDSRKVAILGMKRRYLSCRHFSWRIRSLKAKNSWKAAIMKLLSRFLFFVFFVCFFFPRFSSTFTVGGETAGLRGVRLKRSWL